MLLLRAVLLEILVCFHVIGAAVLFRRLFPRESVWLAFILPTLFVMSLFNFIEHYIALPDLGWLLPFSVAGLLWAIVRPGYSWDELRLPTILFLAIFTWAFFLKCLNPEITCNTEGVADMARVVDFCLGDKLPATDSWCPPYDHGTYYAFQHYGASLLKRLFSLDIGTGYNMGYNLLNTVTILVGAGAAYIISGKKTWVCVLTLLVLLADFTGSAVILFIIDTLHPVKGMYDLYDSRLSIDIGDGWNDPNRHNPFGWIYHVAPQGLRLFTPAFNIYFPEFHANLGGHFMTLASVLAANEAYKQERSNWPWICLVVFPLMTLIMATWYMIVVTVLCVGCFAVALIVGRRPENWRFVFAGIAVGSGLIWPSVNTLISGTYQVAEFHWTPWVEYTAPLEFLIQWWPIIVPWVILLFVWQRMSLLARWIHAALPLLLIFIEVASFGDRTWTVEKMWGAVYGVGLVTFLPLVFIQKNVVFRVVTFSYLFISVIFILAWFKIEYDQVNWDIVAFRLRGDTVFQSDPQKRRLLQELQTLHAATILNGKSEWSYNQSPSLVGFSENRCYIAWFWQEIQCGHGGVADYRDQQSNAFFAGTMQHPLDFLRLNNIAAVVIYPDDQIPGNILQQLQSQIGSEYYYIDCKGDGPNNAGVFMRIHGEAASASIQLPPGK